MENKRLGIICFDNRKVFISLMNNYRLALESYFGVKNLKNIQSIRDLENLDYIFIIDDHMTREIWMKRQFMDYVNNKKINVIVFNFEKIFNSQFKNNINFQMELEKFNNLYQFVSDIDDAEIMGKKLISKQLLSKHTKIKIDYKKNKLNRILFLGKNKQRLFNFKIINPHYEARYRTLKCFKKNHKNFDMLINKNFSYSEYLNKLVNYKYILNPLGTGNFINIRFYEALELGCIPVQQITENMLNRYEELDYCLKFFSANGYKVSNFKFKKLNYYLEDYFDDINLKKII